MYVDIGLGLFALTNGGVKVEGIGAMTSLILISLLVGKIVGIVFMYKLACALGFPAPLGVRLRHVRMIGLMVSLSLTLTSASTSASTSTSTTGICPSAALTLGNPNPYSPDPYPPLQASLSVTVALFVSDVAFTNEKIKGDAKLGALLSGSSGLLCYAISRSIRCIRCLFNLGCGRVGLRLCSLERE